MKLTRLVILIITALSIVGNANAQIQLDRIVCYSSQKPIIDGAAENLWNAIKTDSLKNITVGTQSELYASHFSANFKTTWEDSALYLLVKITDDTLSNQSATNPWDGSAVEILVDGNNDKSGSFDANDHQYIFRWNDNTIYESDSLGVLINNNPTGVSFTQGASPGGYLVEIKINWNAIGVSASEGKLVGFKVKADGHSGKTSNSRIGQIAWFSSINANYPSLFGTVQLDSTSCSAIVNSDSVWPGDINYDIIVNNMDILNIGIGYGDTGTVRNGASNNWLPQVATNDWNNNFLLNLGGINFKHADCNGDGFIDASDTTAIVQNYGLTHGKIVPPLFINGLPDLTFNIPVDSTPTGSAVQIPIILGSAANQADSMYGLAFSISYDPKIIDTTKISLSLNNSWLGTNGANLIYISKNFGSNGRLDIGITRTDHKSISGFGQIGDLGIIMKDDLAGKISGTLYKTLFLKATQIKAITNREITIPINAGQDSVVVVQNIAIGIKKYNINNSVTIYPNPASGSITIDITPIAIDVKEMKLLNVLGEIVWQNKNIAGSKIIIDTHALSAGSYYLSIESLQEKIMGQVNIIR